MTQFKAFCNTLHIQNVTNKIDIKLYRHLRNKIKKTFHSKWKNILLSLEHDKNGHPSVEIDESSII